MPSASVILPEFERNGWANEFWTFSGQVLSIQTDSRSWNESPSMLHGSTTVARHRTEQKIFLKLLDGAEKCYTFINHPVDARNGHSVTVISGGRKGGSDGYSLILINHTLRKWWWVTNFDSVAELISRPNKVVGWDEHYKRGLKEHIEQIASNFNFPA